MSLANSNSGVWKWLASFLAGLLVSGVASFFAVASKPSREEVEKLIAGIRFPTETYLTDRDLIQSRLDTAAELVSSLDEQLRVMQLQVARIEQKVDSLLIPAVASPGGPR